jgi:hypothetical protein
MLLVPDGRVIGTWSENPWVCCRTNHNDFEARTLPDFIRARLSPVIMNYVTSLQQLEPDFISPEWTEKAIGESQYLCHGQKSDEWSHLRAATPGKMPESRR